MSLHLRAKNILSDSNYVKESLETITFSDSLIELDTSWSNGVLKVRGVKSFLEEKSLFLLVGLMTLCNGKNVSFLENIGLRELNSFLSESTSELIFSKEELELREKELKYYKKILKSTSYILGHSTESFLDLSLVDRIDFIDAQLSTVSGVKLKALHEDKIILDFGQEVEDSEIDALCIALEVKLLGMPYTSRINWVAERPISE